MREEYPAFSNIKGPRCAKCKKNEGVHEVGSFTWLCHTCFNLMQGDQRVRHIVWPEKESVDTLLEAVYYLNYTHRDKDYESCMMVGSVLGDKGIVCYLVEEKYMWYCPLFMQKIWPRKFRYYVLYNRRYLEHGESLFERASMHKGLWQTVRRDILDKATAENDLRGELQNNVCIAIVMQNKTIYYINPTLMNKFTFEYETERTPYNEVSPECSIPISKDQIISKHDPFPSIPTDPKLKRPRK